MTRLTTPRPQPRPAPRATRLATLVGAAFSLPLLGSGALAQQAAAEAAPTTITVTGIRASVRSALQAKELSNNQIEVIASEDIGKLPDTTIAESLARLPGLSAGIDRGNASQIVARGLGPRFIGATMNGREFASAEPDRAVRFEMFPSESVSGASIYKTQSANLVEGGIATTIDLQTVSPLAYRQRTASLKADALYYQLGSKIDGADKVAPRLGGIYVDQFADRTVGVALAFSYYDQPSLEDRVDHWGFNDGHHDPAIGKEPWGFQHKVKRGSNQRASVLGKVEYRPSEAFKLTADIYHAKSDIHEPELYHTADTGNWDGWRSGDYSNISRSNGFVTGATVKNVWMTTINSLWKQEMDNTAGGLNLKWKAGDWSVEGDLALSRAGRDTMWTAVGLNMLQSGSTTFNFAQDQWLTYSHSQDTGNPAAFSTSVGETWGPTYAGDLKDRLDSALVTASRSVDFGPVSKLSFGLRATEREKSYQQVSWNYPPSVVIPTSALERIHVEGRPDFVAFKDGYEATINQYFGAAALSAAGRSPTASDLVQRNWRAEESTTSAFAMADLSGELFGLSYRGNAGVRLVRADQTGYGFQSINGATPSPTSDGTSYTKVLPSLNLAFGLDEKSSKLLRIGLSRAMSRAPLDVMNNAHVVSVPTNPAEAITVSGGNPKLKPMMADNLDITFQSFFSPGSLVSVGAFYKKLDDYIGVSSVAGTFNGRAAYYTQQVNRSGGHVSGLELQYQQAFTFLPAPFNGLGLAANYTYTKSNIKENGDQSGWSFKPIDANGLMKSNGGITLWYEQGGWEARLSANHHSAYNRAPTWDSTFFQLNGAETWVSMNLARKLSENLQLRFGVENATNQRVTYTDPLNPLRQVNFQFGRRFNAGITWKL